MVSEAVGNFSKSVTVQTQAGYATAARTYIEAEKALGRPFSSPPTDSELAFLVTFLIRRKLEPATIKNYLSGIRFYLLSMGLPSPPSLPPLAHQILNGYEKGKLDPQETAGKKKRRAISVEMLKLLGHSIAIHTYWTDFEKNLRWAVILVAWWGSFRIGELLPANSTVFNPKNALLVSDVKVGDDSASFWLRSPKVNRESLGDIVEVWHVQERKDLDPITVLKAYLARRHEALGEAKNYPLFLHENGSIYSKHELNKDLDVLLAMYPELKSERDTWSGHSFRAGLATVLSELGFSKEEIQSWGRWSSDAFKVYVKSQVQRRSVRAKLSKTFGSILNYVK